MMHPELMRQVAMSRMADLNRNAEARDVAAKLHAAKPDDEDVKKLVAALAEKK